MRIFKKKQIIEKKEIIPTGDTKEIDTAELWEVRWQSRYDEYSSSLKPEIRVFFSEKDAKEFKKSLEDAFKLIRHTSGTSVSVEKVK